MQATAKLSKQNYATSLICDNFAAASIERNAMLKILLPVDGSESAVRATRTLIDTIAWYR